MKKCIENINCPYCSGPAALVTGEFIYTHRPDLYSKKFYRCEPCDAWVGVHPGTLKPLGRLANAELRSAKYRAHIAFDPIWQHGKKSRSEAYAWLAKELGISSKECHIGMFDLPMCMRVIEVCCPGVHEFFDLTKE